MQNTPAQLAALYTHQVALATAWRNTETFPAWMRASAIQAAENTSLANVAKVFETTISDARRIVSSL